MGNALVVQHEVKAYALWTLEHGKGKMMKRLIVTTIIMVMLLSSTPLLAAEESAPTPQPEPKAVPTPGKRSGTSMSPAALMGLLGAAPKPAAAGSSQEQPLYPMFQMLGPNMTGNSGLTPEAMGTLLTMQGELMMKMGEVLMKYGQMMPGKTN
jgi:hypothetical protein